MTKKVLGLSCAEHRFVTDCNNPKYDPSRPNHNPVDYITRGHNPLGELKWCENNPFADSIVRIAVVRLRSIPSIALLNTGIWGKYDPRRAFARRGTGFTTHLFERHF